MNIIELPLVVLRTQYRIARIPLQLIEDRFVSRLDSEAAARLLYERSLGILDSTVGGLLGDPTIEKRGSALAGRSEALGRAAQLEEQAERKRQQATATLKAKADNAVEDRKVARETKQAQIHEAAEQAEEEKRTAAAQARERTAQAGQQADELAARRKQEAEAAKRDEQAQIKAAEQKATAAASEKARDAAAKRDAAATKRDQADHIEKLADAEKDKRRADRADNKN